MFIFIDADTGTFGIADDLYILQVNDNANIGDLLDHLSDSEISTLGVAFGKRVMDHVWEY